MSNYAAEQLDQARRLLEAERPKQPAPAEQGETELPQEGDVPEANEEPEPWIQRLLRLCGIDVTRCP